MDKKKGLTKSQLLKDAELETDLPSKYTDPKPGSTERPIPRTARRDFIRDFILEGEGPVPKKYLDYADQEAREAAAGERRESRGMKSGGSVSPSKKVLAKSGFYDKGTTKSEREKIVGKVTTKPQRVKMVEKMLSTKKPKRYAEGGLAGLADSANSLMGEVDGMANTINYGSSTSTGSSQPLGLQAVPGFKKGGTVKSSASRRGDGIALRGKTKGRMV